MGMNRNKENLTKNRSLKSSVARFMCQYQVLALLGSLFIIATYNSAPAHAQRKAGPSEPTDFYFLYTNDPKEPRFFVKTGDKPISR